MDSSIRATLFKGKAQKCVGKSLETVIFQGPTENRHGEWVPWINIIIIIIYVNFSSNSTKTVRLFALDFYEAIVDSAFGLINYHLIEISSS